MGQLVARNGNRSLTRAIVELVPPEVKEVSPQFQKWFFSTRGSIVIESSAIGEYSITVPMIRLRDQTTGKYLRTEYFGSLFLDCFLSAEKSAVFEKAEKVSNQADLSEPAEVVLDWPSICQRTQVQMDLNSKSIVQVV